MRTPVPGDHGAECCSRCNGDAAERPARSPIRSAISSEICCSTTDPMFTRVVSTTRTTLMSVRRHVEPTRGCRGIHRWNSPTLNHPTPHKSYARALVSHPLQEARRASGTRTVPRSPCTRAADEQGSKRP